MNEMMAWVQYSNSIGFSFEGRARRREYWWNWLYWNLILFAFAVCVILIHFVVAIFFSGNHGTVIAPVGSLMMILVGIASFVIEVWKLLPITIRRFHDRGLSGWIYLVCVVISCFCGIGSIAALVICCLDSQPGTNQYGPNPKEPVQVVDDWQ